MSFTSERCPPALPGPPKRRFRLSPMGGELVGMVVAGGYKSHRFHSSDHTHGISERPGFESLQRNFFLPHTRPPPSPCVPRAPRSQFPRCGDVLVFFLKIRLFLIKVGKDVASRGARRPASDHQGPGPASSAPIRTAAALQGVLHRNLPFYMIRKERENREKREGKRKEKGKERNKRGNREKRERGVPRAPRSRPRTATDPVQRHPLQMQPHSRPPARFAAKSTLFTSLL